MEELEAGLEAYILFYNTKRLHQSLGNQRPSDIYFEGKTDEYQVGRCPTPQDICRHNLGENGEVIATLALRGKQQDVAIKPMSKGKK